MGDHHHHHQRLSSLFSYKFLITLTYGIVLYRVRSDRYASFFKKHLPGKSHRRVGERTKITRHKSNWLKYEHAIKACFEIIRGRLPRKSAKDASFFSFSRGVHSKLTSKSSRRGHIPSLAVTPPPPPPVRGTKKWSTGKYCPSRWIDG